MSKSSLTRVSEHEEQATFIEAVGRIYGHRDDFIQTLLFAVPNGSWFGGNNQCHANELHILVDVLAVIRAGWSVCVFCNDT